MAGYIKLHRKMLDWEWYSDPNTFRVFMHLLLTASYEDHKFRGQDIKAGQVVVGRKKLAKDLGMGEQSVRTALSHLQATGEITIQPTNKYTVVTIEKWGKYQIQDTEPNQQSNQQLTSKLTNDQPTTNHIQEGKKVRIKNNNRAFTPPSVDEVRAYCSERKNGVDPEVFVDFYQGKGWMVGKNKMKDWRAAVRTWEKSRKEDKKTQYKPEPPKYPQFEPEPEIEGTQMPDEIRRKLKGMFT